MSNILEDAVQPEAWYKKLPRPMYSKLEKIDIGQPWFEVYRLPKDVFALYEPGHFQEVISYLVIGEKKALLWDTGMGIDNIRTAAEKLTDKPLIVVNSHTHFDHIGDNHRFDMVHVFDYPAAIKRLSAGMSVDELKVHLRGDSIRPPAPPEFDRDDYHIPPCRFTPIHDGHVFDLGGRVLEAIHTPGHSPDSIMLLDRENRLLFTGDTFYPATLYAHLDGSEFKTYRQTMERLAAMAGEVDHILTSHNEPLRSMDDIVRTAEAFQAIRDGQADYTLDRQGLRLYEFQGFAIVTPDDDKILV